MKVVVEEVVAELGVQLPCLPGASLTCTADPLRSSRISAASPLRLPTASPLPPSKQLSASLLRRAIASPLSRYDWQG